MFVRLKKSSGTVNPIVQIVESYREGGRVRQRVLASLGSIQDDNDLERLNVLARNMLAKIQQERTKQKRLFEDPSRLPVLEKRPKRGVPKGQGSSEPLVKIENLQHTETVHDGFVAVVERLFSTTGLSDIAVHKPTRMAFDPLRIAKILVAQRFFDPASKHRTFQRQKDIGVDDLKLQQIYRGMDSLVKSEELFQRCAIEAGCGQPGLFKQEIECLFVDVTTLYFESVTTDALRNFGYSKDQKFHSVQVVLCLIVNSDGIPVAYETFPGNTAEVSTVSPVVDKLKQRFDVKKITIVCDRGLASKENIEKLGSLGIGYVAACKIKHLPAKLKLNDLSTYESLEKKEDNEILVRRIAHPRYADSELIVTWSKKRAAKDKSDRDCIIKRLQGKLGKKQSSSPKLKKLVNNKGYLKYVEFSGDGKWSINAEAEAKAASWDGFHALAVSKSSNLTNAAALAQYRGLYRIEEAFRVSKSHLEIRPMFHWTTQRIRAHILICFISLFLERYLEKMLRINNTPLTPDRIRYALQRAHSIHFQDTDTGRCGVMESTLSPDAKSIFEVLTLPLKRGTKLL